MKHQNDEFFRIEKKKCAIRESGYPISPEFTETPSGYNIERQK